VSAAEMEQLLRKGAYALMAGDEHESQVQAFCEEDIDQILSNRSRKVHSRNEHNSVS
jgi:hypothetical protein